MGALSIVVIGSMFLGAAGKTTAVLLPLICCYCCEGGRVVGHATLRGQSCGDLGWNHCEDRGYDRSCWMTARWIGLLENFRPCSRAYFAATEAARQSSRQSRAQRC